VENVVVVENALNPLIISEKGTPFNMIDAIPILKDLISFIGDDPKREGLEETPARIANSYTDLFKGYRQNPKNVFKTFDGSQIGGLVYLKNIEFYSFCEHHMLPFYGQAHIGYIPNGRVIGASKLARLLDIFSCRLQIQERIGEQVTEALMTYLKPLGAACVTEAKHLCISCRGVKKQHSILGYSSMKGIFLENSFEGISARNEFLSLIK
jgi:GTP cyclohydrolase I